MLPVAVTVRSYLGFQMAEVAVPQELFRRLLDRIDRLRPRPSHDVDPRKDGRRFHRRADVRLAALGYAVTLTKCAA
jgi:hypothetical protein